MTLRAALADRFAALGRLARTTAVRLSLLYLVVFSAFTVFLIVGVTHDAGRLVTRQLHEAIDADVEALQDQFRDGGLVRMIDTLDDRGRRPGAGLYYVVDTAGNPIAGNVGELPPGALAADGDDDDPRPLPYVRFENGREVEHVALVRSFRLDNGFQVLVGRDLGERDRLRQVFRKSFRYVVVLMVVIAGLTWWFLSRRVLRRIDQVSAASRRIVDGDLSGRLAVTGSGDEFDRLAVGLNDMLERIGGLMRGVKEVGDAVAHDLKTPLTRLRNRTEAALAGPESAEAYREALEATLDESNALIRTFDALLTISRLEAGAGPRDAVAVDVAALVREVCELYEPLAEEAGGTLVAEIAAGDHILTGNRELLAQALANLLDNALKYGRDANGVPTVVVSLAGSDGDLARSGGDRGAGGAAPDRDRILGRFVRLEASRSAPGSGLGLSLVAAIARLHRLDLSLADAAPGLRVTLAARHA